MINLPRVVSGAFADGCRKTHHASLSSPQAHSLLATAAACNMNRALLSSPCGYTHASLYITSLLSSSPNPRTNQGPMFLVSCSASAMMIPSLSSAPSCQGGPQVAHAHSFPSSGLLCLPSRAVKPESPPGSTGHLSLLERVDSARCFRDDSARCFRDDDAPYPDQLTGRDPGDLGNRARMELAYSPWALTMMEGINKPSTGVKESTGGPSGGGGKGDGDGDGDGGGGGGDGEGDEHIYLLPILTLAFAALHLGYCLAIWLRGDGPEGKFGTGLGLFGLLFLAACRLEHRTGIDAYILGLGASVGSLVWSGERWYVRREVTLAGILACFAAGMAAIFTAALYHSL